MAIPSPDPTTELPESGVPATVPPVADGDEASPANKTWEPWESSAPKTPSTSEDPDRPPASRPVRKRRKWLRVTLISLLVLVVLAGVGAVVGWRYLRSVESDVTRVDAFSEVVEAERPEKPAAQSTAMNILILGSDSRNPDVRGSRTDTIMIAHVSTDHTSAQVVSIPRDTWVDVPRSASGQGGRKAKINAGFAWGGIALMVRTVEKFSKVRIDHVIVVDFAGFAKIVDSVGGVDVTVPKSFTSIHPPFRSFHAGRNHFDGDEALDYSRQRKQFSDGDFDRIEHQQQVIRAILAKATSAGILTDPGKLSAFLRAAANSVTVDKGFDLLSTATSLRGIDSKHIRFLTNPSTGTGMEGTESVVYSDAAKSASLFAAINADTAAAWTAP